jgi:hypothetical protein
VLGASREQFRATVEQFYAMGEAGRPMLDALLSVAGAFDQLHPEVDATVDSLTGAKDAATEYNDRLQDQARDLQATVNSFRGYAEALRKFRGELTRGDLAQLTPEARYGVTRAEFMRLAQMDPANEERLKGLQSVSEEFLKASQGYNAGNASYFLDLAQVRGAVGASEAAAFTTADVAQLQLDVLTRQLAALQAIQANTGATAQASVTSAALAVQGNGFTVGWQPGQSIPAASMPSSHILNPTFGMIDAKSILEGYHRIGGVTQARDWLLGNGLTQESAPSRWAPTTCHATCWLWCMRASGSRPSGSTRTRAPATARRRRSRACVAMCSA